MASKFNLTLKPIIKKSTAEKKTKKNKKLKSTLRTIKNTLLKRRNIDLLKTRNTLLKQLKLEKYKNSKVTAKFNMELLQDDDFTCTICCEVFIKPSLLSCSHMFCEWCIDKSLEKYNYCPMCRVPILTYVPCLNMRNFILRKMELMPEEFQLAYKNLEKSRAEDKKLSMELCAERLRLERITRELNTRSWDLSM